jgi:CubicO group peptidase (beta-lactamase class C family)
MISAALVLGGMSEPAQCGDLHKDDTRWLQKITNTLLVDSNTPGVGIVVVTPDEITTTIAGKRAATNDALIQLADPWHLGSNTKSMTAVLAARLVEAGAISWDTTVEDLLGEDFPAMQDAYRKASLAHLLSHRAGLPANIDLAKFGDLAGTDEERDAVQDRATYVGWILSDPAAAALGEKDLYSNAGFVVAAVMMEKAAQKPYETLMQEQVFGPLNLSQAGWGPPGTPGKFDAPYGHNLYNLPIEPTAQADNPVAMNSAGRAHMPLADIASYLRTHLIVTLGQDKDYLSPQSWMRLHTPSFGGQFAMGWVALPNGVLVHAGSNTMWFCQFVIVPEQKTAIAIVTNSGRIQALQPHFRAVIGKILGRNSNSPQSSE